VLDHSLREMDVKLTRRRVIVGLLASVVLVLGTIVVAPFVAMFVYFRKMGRRAWRGREHLFCETDYQELLAACRELSQQQASGTLKKALYHVHLGQRDPETLSFPQVILDLEPALIRLGTGGLGEVCIIELFPGPDWYGVLAFPEGSPGRGEVKLIDGLWYSDPDYRDAYPDYMEEIDAMIEKGRRLRANRQTPPMPLPQPK
jgi:hypothetical protein